MWTHAHAHLLLITSGKSHSWLQEDQSHFLARGPFQANFRSPFGPSQSHVSQFFA